MEENKDNNKLYLVLLIAAVAYYYFFVRNAAPRPENKVGPAAPPNPDIDGIMQGPQMPPEAMGMPKKTGYANPYKAYYDALKQAEKEADQREDKEALEMKLQAYSRMLLEHPVYRKLVRQNAVASGNSFAKQLKIESKWLVRQGAHIEL